MKTTLLSYPDKTHEVELHFSCEQRGYGQWNILCEVTIPGVDAVKRKFKHYITDAEFIDRIHEMNHDESVTHEEIQAAFFDKAFNAMEEAVTEWVADELEKEEE